MQEYGAAPAGNPRPRVVIDFDDQVVQMVVTPEAVARLIGRATERTIVAAVTGIFAPGHGGIDADCGQPRQRLAAAVGAPPQPPEAETAARRGTIALPLVGTN